MESGHFEFQRGNIENDRTPGVRREEVLENLVESRPELRQFLSPGAILRARGIFDRIDEILDRHPKLLTKLELAYQESPNSISMLVFPLFPLVVARTEHGLVGLAPVLSCTLNAIEHVSNNIPRGLAYAVLTSPSTSDELEEVVWGLSEQDRVVINYDPERINPTDYIALACKYFSNEVFRKSV